MSLKARLRFSIVALVITIVTALSLLDIPFIVNPKFDDLLVRADITAKQVQSSIDQSLRERAKTDLAKPNESELDYSIRLLRSDPTLKDTLVSGVSASDLAIAEVQIVDRTGRVLASNIDHSIGRLEEPTRDMQRWRQESVWRKLAGLVLHSQDISIAYPIGPREKAGEVFYSVRLLLSPVFLWTNIEPDLLNIAVLSVVSLLVSVILAILVSNLALRPLALISERLDKIAAGEMNVPLADVDSRTSEVAAVETKLSLLGERFRDARQNALQLKSNVDQLLQRLEEAVLLFDPNGYVLLAGRPAERLLGRSQVELVGKQLQDIFPANTPQGIRIQKAIENQQSLEDFPVILERPGQPAARLVLNLDCFSQSGNAPMGMLLTLRDADLRREIYSQLDVSSRLASINRLTSGVAHEIKNPLNAIRLHLEVLKSKLEEEPEAESSLKVIDSEIVRLDKVVKTFLDFTRPVQFHLGDVELHQLAQEVILLVKPAAQQRRMKLALDDASTPVAIRGDRDTLKQAVLNLMINGIDAMSEGGQLTLTTRQVFDEAVFTVADTGCGIPTEVQDKVFQLYFTTKKEGSGIGLPMTFQVVQLHNGILEFQSEVGKGTTFRLRFPLLTAHAPVTENAEAKQSV